MVVAMFYMVSRNENGQWKEKLYSGKSKQFKDEIKELKVKTVIDFEINGKSYAEKQNNLRDLAIAFGDAQVQVAIANKFAPIGLSYSEMQDVYDFFATNGRRYGLYKEFKENGIC